MISCKYLMPKKAVSVTLDSDNLLWLKARAGTAGVRSVSELLDRLVTEARTAGAHLPVRSVVGTIDIDPADPSLEQVDASVRTLFDASLRRPSVVRESAPRYAAPRRKPRRRG